jgi:site-specific DNA recombinase
MSIMSAERRAPWSPPVKRAVIYTRASLDATGEGRSVERQLEACRALATARGWEVVAEEQDNSISAYGEKHRPGWSSVLELVEAKRVDLIVAWHLDRMSRSTRELDDLIVLAEKKGVGIATATGDFDLSNDTGRMVARILAAVARAEVERKAARQRLANEQRASSGKPWTGGARPFGYTPCQTMVVEEEAQAIKQAAVDALGGTSMSEIARRWDAQGLVSSRASEHTTAGWTGRGVKGVLVSPRYAGIRTYRGEEVGQGTWPAILDLETHLALKAKLTDPSRLLHNHRKGRTPANLLSGLIFCEVCESPLNASTNRGRPTYICRGGGHVQPSRDKADRHVQEWLVGLLSTPDVLASLTSTGDASDEVRGEVDALRSRLAVLGESFVEGVVDAATFRSLSGKLKDRIEAAEAALMRVSVGGVLDGIDVGTERVLAQWNELELPRKRAIIEALLDIDVHRRSGERGGRPDTLAWDPSTQMTVRLKAPV